MLNRKHLLGIEDLSRDEILEILDTADSLQEVSTRPIKKVPTRQNDHQSFLRSVDSDTDVV